MQRLSATRWAAAIAVFGFLGYLPGSATLAQPFFGTTTLEATRSDPAEHYGAQVIVDRDTLVVSSPSFDGGLVYIYERDEADRDAWSLARRHSPPEGCHAWSVALAGDTLVVGGCNKGGCSSSGPGTVHVYERNKGGAGNWGLFQTLRAENPTPVAHTFGWAVAVGADNLAIGDPKYDTVRVYERLQPAAGGWVEAGRLMRDDVPGLGSFGSNLEISGGTLAVGAANYCVGPSTGDFHSEGVYVFERDQTAEAGWRETRHLDNPPIEGLPGEIIALEGPTLMFDGLDGIEIHERDYRGRKRWGQRQLLDQVIYAISVRGRTAVQISSGEDGSEVVVRDRFGLGRTPWIVTEALVDSSAAGAQGPTDAAVGSREVVAGYGVRGLPAGTQGKAVIYHRQPIHADGFEGGDLSLWDKPKRKVAIAEPGLNGSSYALEVLADGKGKKSFLRTRSPESEPMISLGFTLNANDVGLGAEDVEILRLSGGGKKNVTLTLRELAGKYRVTLWAKQNSGELMMIGELDLPRRADARLLLEWQRATGDGHGNGVARLTRIGSGSIQSTSLATDRLAIGDIKIGFPAGAKGTAGGSYLIDDVALHQ